MLEIIAIIFIARKFGATADKKGLKKGQWKLYGILSFILPTYILVFGIAATTGEVGLALIGYLAGIISTVIVHNVLKNKPDASPDTSLFGTTEKSSDFEEA